VKAKIFIIPAILAVAACQQMEVDNSTPVEKPEKGSMATLTLTATKGEAHTKALDLVNDGTRLNAYWKSTETVKVYKDGTLLGSLSVSPADGEKPTSATLSGSINTTGLAVNDALTLMIPRDGWDYTGQTGKLTGEDSVEDTYSYAMATINVASVDNGTVVPAANAVFSNQQSIYRLGFVDNGYLDPREVTIFATGGKLVRSVSYEGAAWTQAFGWINVVPAAAAADHFYYVSLRNDSTAADTYSFSIIGSDFALYTAAKNIPADALDVPGKFISAKDISATKANFAPTTTSGTTTNTAL